MPFATGALDVYCLQFPDEEENEAQPGAVTSPGSHSLIGARIQS